MELLVFGNGQWRSISCITTLIADGDSKTYNLIMETPVNPSLNDAS